MPGAVVEQAGGDYRQPIDRAISFLLQLSGNAGKMPEEDIVGHDSELVGWPWVEGTHSWLEPTAFAVLGLKRVGLAHHERVREGVRILIDRQLPGGGCNYGNTFVFGQKLIEHIQPSGLAVMALSDELAHPRVAATVNLLRQAWPQATGTASVCFAAMGMAAVEQVPDQWMDRLQSLYSRQAMTGDSPYRLSLIALASLGEDCPWLDRAEVEIVAPESAGESG